MSDQWWTWRWDTTEADGERFANLRPLLSVKRWRRGSFLTVYRFIAKYETRWWFYGPFNLAIGFAIPRRHLATAKETE